MVAIGSPTGRRIEASGKKGGHLLDAATNDVTDKNVKSSSSSCMLRCEDQVEDILGTQWTMR